MQLLANNSAIHTKKCRINKTNKEATEAPITYVTQEKKVRIKRVR